MSRTEAIPESIIRSEFPKPVAYPETRGEPHGKLKNDSGVQFAID
jgi:hypothetical protein